MLKKAQFCSRMMGIDGPKNSLHLTSLFQSSVLYITFFHICIAYLSQIKLISASYVLPHFPFYMSLLILKLPLGISFYQPYIPDPTIKAELMYYIYRSRIVELLKTQIWKKDCLNQLLTLILKSRVTLTTSHNPSVVRFPNL